MTDPSRRDEWGQEHPGTYSYPAIPDQPDGRQAPYERTHQAPARSNPTQQLPAYSPYGYDPYATAHGPPNGPGGTPPETPEPPRDPNPRRWLWAAAGCALLLALGMVIGLVMSTARNSRR